MFRLYSWTFCTELYSSYTCFHWLRWEIQTLWALSCVIIGKYKISLSFSSDLKHICLHLLLHLFENFHFLLDRRLWMFYRVSAPYKCCDIIIIIMVMRTIDVLTTGRSLHLCIQHDRREKLTHNRHCPEKCLGKTTFCTHLSAIIVSAYGNRYNMNIGSNYYE